VTSWRCSWWRWAGWLLALAGAGAPIASKAALIDQNWLEVRTPHFQVYSCVATQEVLRLAGRLEQFHIAYALLAGAQAVVSPPMAVAVFPDREAMQPFLAPDLQGNLQGFFAASRYGNMIVMALTGSGARSTEVIFHEYAHHLFRHNANVWPLWLVEGMAEIYATFDVTGSSSVCIGKPMDHYVAFLKRNPMMPLPQLFGVNRDSPEYNERERQGLFYAQSWLLTHYLMLGNGRHKTRLGQFTTLLRAGQSTTQAFTNTFQVSLGAMEKELQGYLAAGRFPPLYLSASGVMGGQQAFAIRRLGRAEVCYRFGFELVHVRRFDDAGEWFNKAKSLEPTNPCGSEGLGFLAYERGDCASALKDFRDAFARKSSNYLAHYFYALALRQARYVGSSRSAAPRDEKELEEIRSHLRSAIGLMPSFGPTHYLLAESYFLERDDLIVGERFARRAVELEPYSKINSALLGYIHAAQKGQSIIPTIPDFSPGPRRPAPARP
jgi:tetratricopeptide (TPR) repeat protein